MGTIRAVVALISRWRSTVTRNSLKSTEGVCFGPVYRPNPRAVEGATTRAVLEARTREALIEAMGAALFTISARDAGGLFGHCGYRTAAQLL